MHASCQFLIVLCVAAQFTGTEMPCEDLSPSPTTPTSGKMRLKVFLEHLGDLKLSKKVIQILSKIWLIISHIDGYSFIPHISTWE